MMESQKLIGRVVTTGSKFFGNTPSDKFEKGTKGFIYSVDDLYSTEVWYVIFENGIGLDFDKRSRDNFIRLTGEKIDKKQFVNKDFEDVCEKVKRGVIKINKKKKR